MKREDKERIAATIAVLFILLLIFFLLLQVDLIKDKNNYIINIEQEKQELTDSYGDMIQKYIDEKTLVEKYQRKYGDIND